VSLLVVMVLQERCVVKGRVTGQAPPHSILQEQTTISQSRKPRTYIDKKKRTHFRKIKIEIFGLKGVCDLDLPGWWGWW